MTNKEAIDSLRMCQALMLFNPTTGETHKLENENKDNKDLYTALEVAIASLSQVTEWISVDVKLPTKKGEYLVAYHPCYWDRVVREETLIGTDTFRGKNVWAKYRYKRNTHWMPMPQPPSL